MEYYKQYEYHGTYSTTTKNKAVSLEDFRLWISTMAKENEIGEIVATAGTRIPFVEKSWKNFFRRSDHILTVDCDSMEDMFATTRVFKRDGIGWAGIESSPGRYWIVADVVGKFPDLYRILAALPGVDQEYVKATKRWGVFLLRALPRAGVRPNFGPTDDLTNPRVIDWYNQFKALHEDPVISENISLITSLKNGDMAGVAADPNFDI